MSTSCHIFLPKDARIRDVVDVMGILAGLTPSKMDLGKGDWAVRVEGASAEPSSMPEMALLFLRGDLIDGQTEHHCYFHYESEDVRYNMVSTSYTSFWLAIARGLVDFFGGYVDYNDCDDIEIDYTHPKRGKNNPSDGVAWNKFQQRMLDVAPLQHKDVIGKLR